MTVLRELSPFVFLALLISTLVIVLWRGGRDERACITVIAVGSVLSAIVAQPKAFRGDETGVFMVDVAVLIAFIAIMARSNRFWPLWITAFQIIAVVTHLARFLQPQTVPLAYAIAEQLWVLPMQSILIAAVLYRGTATKHEDLTNSLT